MDRKQFIQNFSSRLANLMRDKGHESSRSKAGIDIKKLAKVTGCSYQMARKYALGEALPELFIIVKIADWLNTPPSWLLFGDHNSLAPKKTSTIEIQPELLKYILTKSFILFSYTNDTATIVNFIVDSIYDASHLNADMKTIHKVIDMMIASATLLNNTNMDYQKDVSKKAISA